MYTQFRQAAERECADADNVLNSASSFEGIRNLTQLEPKCAPYVPRLPLESVRGEMQFNECPQSRQKQIGELKLCAGYDCTTDGSFYAFPDRENTFRNHFVRTTPPPNETYCVKNHQYFNNWTKRRNVLFETTLVQPSPELPEITPLPPLCDVFSMVPSIENEQKNCGS